MGAPVRHAWNIASERPSELPVDAVGQVAAG
jgi:hypothetical protein